MKQSNEKTDSDYQTMMLERQFTISKHLGRISNNLIFFFWLTMISLLIFPFLMFLGALGSAMAF